MTEPVSALSAPRVPDGFVNGLPMPPLPAKHLRVPKKDPSKWWVLLLVVVMGMLLFPLAGLIVANAVVTAVVMGGVWWVMRTIKTFVAAHKRGLTLLEAGDVDGALAMFDELARRRFILRLQRAGVVFNIGLVQARRGHLDAALSAFSAVHQSSAMQGSLAADLGLPLLIADSYARLGDVVAARLWLEEARKAPSSRTNLVHYTEALVLLREGRFDDAERIYAASWSALEDGVVGIHVRTGADVRVLRAYAAARRGGSTDALLAPLRPATPGAAAHLATSWPDLQSFLVDAGL